MLKCAWISETGGRPINEDAVSVSFVGERCCFVVCDGLGGHDRGDVASKTVANIFANELCFAEDLTQFLPGAFQHAQQAILAKQKEGNDMRTTAVVLAADADTAYVGHVGDSRCYGFTADGRYFRTLDHSIPQVLVQSGAIEEKQIRNHPSRNMLLKVIGEPCEDTLAELQEPFPLKECAAFLLCSDGFWELILEEDMVAALRQSATPQQWLDQMTEIVRKNAEGKKTDNYSAVAIFQQAE